MHLLSLLTAFPVMEKYNLPEKESEAGWGERDKERETNIRIQITQQEGASYYRILYA